jgi:hypothetical protein
MSKHPWHEFDGPAEPIRHPWWWWVFWAIGYALGYLKVKGPHVLRGLIAPPPPRARAPKPWTFGRVLKWILVGWLLVATWPLWLMAGFLLLAALVGSPS